MIINLKAALIVSLLAFAVTTLVVIISARLSQQKRKDELMAEIKKYNQLSKDASDVGAKGIYAAYQKQGNEKLMDYFVAMYKEAVVEMALHVLALGMIQRYYFVEIIPFPTSIWFFGDGLGSMAWYVISAVAFFFAVIKPLKPKVRYFRPYWQ
ncbi:uncharacterized protein YxeA [Desulfohalotomaculum tongense]|uniref:hypothetical protein n=1 Tax=Desulforadius tongensis TaxID=1216062 RepID=UPI00195A288F|nr:hypothetical protein [Desulforadius tongensis]MBM7855377.1 uncharacterized protein YxeA [Desulforadius tongensis]